jgi:HEAT repeat protein
MQHTHSLLRNRNASVRLGAIKELSGSSVDLSMMKIMAELLQDSDQSIRVETVKKLGQLGPDTLPLLGQALQHPDTLVRREAAAALGKLGATAEPAVPALVAALRDADSRVRMGAATALGHIGPAAQAAIPDLILALRDGNLIFCRLAAQALSLIGPSAVGPLTEALRQDDANVRREAAWALGQLGPQAQIAVQALTELLGGHLAATQTANPPTADANAANVVTAVINIAPARSDDTQVIADLTAPRVPETDAKVRESALQALDRIRGKQS